MVLMYHQFLKTSNQTNICLSVKRITQGSWFLETARETKLRLRNRGIRKIEEKNCSVKLPFQSCFVRYMFRLVKLQCSTCEANPRKWLLVWVVGGLPPPRFVVFLVAGASNFETIIIIRKKKETNKVQVQVSRNRGFVKSEFHWTFLITRGLFLFSSRLSPSVVKDNDTVIRSEDGNHLTSTEKSQNRKRKHQSSDKHEHRRKSKKKHKQRSERKKKKKRRCLSESDSSSSESDSEGQWWSNSDDLKHNWSQIIRRATHKERRVRRHMSCRQKCDCKVAAH